MSPFLLIPSHQLKYQIGAKVQRADSVLFPSVKCFKLFDWRISELILMVTQCLPTPPGYLPLVVDLPGEGRVHS